MNIKEYAGLNSVNERSNGEKMSHEELFTKIVNGIGLDTCARYMPASISTLRKALETDPHLNNIKLEKWDRMHPSFRHTFRRIGVRSLSLSDTVCTLKQAARMLVERDNVKTETERKEAVFSC
ncbi:hypothetical protein [Metabacillus sp. SLBN-84]